MLATLLVFAQEVAEEEHDQTLFYILGGLAAVWAIVLFAVGMRSPRLPVVGRRAAWRHDAQRDHRGRGRSASAVLTSA